MTHLIVKDAQQPPVSPVIPPAPASNLPKGLVIRIRPPSATAQPLSVREIVPTNDRAGGVKYVEAIEALEAVVDAFADGQAIATIVQAHADAQGVDKKQFLFRLKTALIYIKASNLDVRERNTQIISWLRSAQQTPYYQAKIKSGSLPLSCQLLQRLCSAKFTEVYPYDSCKQLLDRAVVSGNNSAFQQLPHDHFLDKSSVGNATREFNRALGSASSEFARGMCDATVQKLCGQLGVNYDPLANSNVPYLRSEFACEGDGRPSSVVKFVRMGTPTIQVHHQQTQICPMFLGFLEEMEQRGANFLYVNHQKFSSQEGDRAYAIKAIASKHKNFYFMSVPLDGPIVKAIAAVRPIEEFKTLVLESFVNGTNGCILPKPPLAKEHLQALLTHVHFWWFAGKPNLSRAELEAFWGIFQTVLKHAVIKQHQVQAMCSTCKDCVDRGGALGTIDEAVRNLLTNGHEKQANLRQLGYNALIPYVVKCEPILDDPSNLKKHRLGYFVSVMNHIATLNPLQVAGIQQAHADLCFLVTRQSVPVCRRALQKQEALRYAAEHPEDDEWMPFGWQPVKPARDEEMKREY